MKKHVLSIALLGCLIGAGPAHAMTAFKEKAQKKLRVLKCSIPKFHTKYNCTAQEKAEGKKWLTGTAIAAAAAAIATVIAGITAAEVKKAKEDAMKEGQIPTWDAMKKKYAITEKPLDKPFFQAVLAWKMSPKNIANVNRVKKMIDDVEKNMQNISLEGINAAIEASEVASKEAFNPEISRSIKLLKNKKEIEAYGPIGTRLPDGWVQYRTPEGETAYYHEKTGHTTYDKSKTVLPNDWKEYQTPEGTAYQNTVTGKTQWEWPNQ